MATSRKPKGQRTQTNSASGEKRRSPTSTSHKGSRVEPSHITTQKRSTQAKKATRGK